MLQKTYPFELPPLPYAYNALEPFIDEKTMHIHHDKHFKTYIDNLNKALAPYPRYHSFTLEQLLVRPSALPREAQTAVVNNGGGVYNHARFFDGLSSSPSLPSGDLAVQIDSDFGGLERFKEEFISSALSVFGSGWTYLVRDHAGRLRIINLANQDTLVPKGLEPIIIADVWEHAYYLKYQNLRAEYLQNLWNVLSFPG